MSDLRSCSCGHTKQKIGLCDVKITSKTSLLVMDVPCQICEACEKIQFTSPVQKDAIDVASLKSDGTYGALIATAQSTDQRKDWAKICMWYRSGSERTPST